VLVAWIFALLGFIVDLFILIIFWWTIIGAIFPIIGIWVFFRTNSIKAAVDKGDATTASRLNTITFNVIALIFSWVITGILLLVAKGYIDRAAQPWVPTPPPPPSVTPHGEVSTPSAAEIYCVYCGAKNSVDAKFCYSCGRELKK
jgi:hypothetical protein